jgi:hypothetical protein
MPTETRRVLKLSGFMICVLAHCQLEAAGNAVVADGARRMRHYEASDIR